MDTSPRNDRGFTLPELLISIVILGAISLAVGSAFVVSMRGSERSQSDISAGIQQFSLSSWFLADAQSAAGVNTAANVTSSCNGVPAHADSTHVATLSWDDLTVDPPTHTEVVYRTERTAASEPWDLARYYCLDDVLQTRVAVVHELAGSGAATVQRTGDRLDVWVDVSISGDLSTLAATGNRRAD